MTNSTKHTKKSKSVEQKTNMINHATESKTTLSEQQFKRTFEPSRSKKDGKAQLTYAGYQHSVNNNGGAFLKIVFSILDVTGKNPQNISVLSSYKYSDTNVLGKILKTMGYVHSCNTVVIDADDEFGEVVEDDFDAIYNFLDEQKGLVFKGFCEKQPNKKDELWYRIDVESIEPCLDKTGNQKRAYSAMEGVSNEYLTVDIDAHGGDN
jgi:hypothetical protein